ncbi:MAG: hypothetical protein WBG70_19255, partial [Spirulinaceae cyanobacterium]
KAKASIRLAVPITIVIDNKLIPTILNLFKLSEPVSTLSLMVVWIKVLPYEPYVGKFVISILQLEVLYE